jgi:Glycosyl hydrolase family 48
MKNVYHRLVTAIILLTLSLSSLAYSQSNEDYPKVDPNTLSKFIVGTRKTAYDSSLMKEITSRVRVRVYCYNGNSGYIHSSKRFIGFKKRIEYYQKKYPTLPRSIRLRIEYYERIIRIAAQRCGMTVFTPTPAATLTPIVTPIQTPFFSPTVSMQTPTPMPTPIIDVGGNNFKNRFLELYKEIKDPANGYFSPEGLPYHSIETLIVEAPDYGHTTTSEGFSYWLLLEAVYGKMTGNWQPLAEAWSSMEKNIIPTTADQPSTQFYNPSSPATYAAEFPQPNSYPSQLQFGASVGKDPLAAELQSAYGTSEIYGMHWLVDSDNWYGYGKRGDGTSRPSYINTFQRGPQESVWETVPHPSWEEFKWGGKNGFLDLFTGDANYSRQWRYTNAPDADARAVQAVYWAKVWADAAGGSDVVNQLVAKATKMGDYLRYSMFDKYFKKIGNCVGISSCQSGTGKDSSHYLLSWYYSWGGSLTSQGGWSWRIGSSHAHMGYQNPMTAYILSKLPSFKPRSATGANDWQMSLERQIEFYRWLQSADGGIAGGATNSWEGSYSSPPAGKSTFYGMFYDEQPVYRDPPSNQWYGFQVWSMERVAEYYFVTGDARAKQLLDKWVNWSIANIKFTNNSFEIPATLQWQGQPDTWNPQNPSANSNLRVKVVEHSQDLGVAASLVRTLNYYGRGVRKWQNLGNQKQPSENIARELINRMWLFRDEQGLSVPEVRKDYSRFKDGIYLPNGWSGKMSNGDLINNSSTFLSIRSKYLKDPAWSKVEQFLNGGKAPEFRYHRFWAQAETAIALAELALADE